MGSFLMAGGGESGSEDHWKEDRVFTGDNPCYPIELFIALMEGEALIFQHDQAKIATNAWCLLSTNSGSPECKLWTSKFQPKYLKKGQPCSWPDLKADLLEAFGRKAPYTFADNVRFLRSLAKGQVESYQTFLLRVQWVLRTLLACGNNSQDWAKLLFLAGLSEADVCGIDEIFIQDKSVQEVCESLCGSIKEEEDSFDHEDFVKVEIEDKSELKRVSKSSNGKSKRLKTELEEVKDEEITDISADEDEEDEESLSLECKKCSIVFESSQLKHDHMKSHYKSKKYCGLCKVTCNNRLEWDKHEAQFHLGECGICGIVINDLKVMRRHHFVAHGRDQVNCPTCSLAIKYHEVGSHKCCPPSADPSVAVGRKNRVLRRGLRMYILKEGESPAKVKSMTTHIMGLEEGVTKCYCGYCQQEFSQIRQLTKHTHSAHEGKKYRCDECLDFRSKVIQEVVEHKLNVHDIVTETFDALKCKLCNYKTFLQSRLDFHLRHKCAFSKEQNKEERTCKVCNKEFSSFYQVDRHVATVHMKYKRYVCSHANCTQAFVYQIELKKHIEAVHSEGGPPPKKPPAICSLCGVKTKDEEQLRKHTRWSHGDKAVEQECKLCGQVLKNEKSLFNHMKALHQKDKHHKCPSCPKTFATKYKMKLHINKEHENIKPFSCGLCNNSYMLLKECAIHIATKHDNWSKEKALKDYRTIIDSEHSALIRNKLN